jgi:hypothetical protein
MKKKDLNKKNIYNKNYIKINNCNSINNETIINNDIILNNNIIDNNTIINNDTIFDNNTIENNKLIVNNTIIHNNKKCSYCKIEGHSINNCQEEKMKLIFDEFENNINNDYINNIDFLLEIINNMVKKHNTISTNILVEQDYIKNIIEYYIQNNKYINLRIISKFNNLSSSVPKSYHIYQLTKIYLEKIYDNFFLLETLIKEIVLLNNYDILNNLLNNEFMIEKYTMNTKRNKIKFNHIHIAICILSFIKFKCISHEFIIELFYEKYYLFKKNVVILKGIHLAIDKLFEFNYKFDYQSIYHVRNWDISFTLIPFNEKQNNITDKDPLYKDALYKDGSYKDALCNTLIKVCNTERCPICMDDIECNNIIKTNCDHNLCSSCLNGIIKSLKPYKKPTCALCRTNITNIKLYDEKITEKLVYLYN